MEKVMTEAQIREHVEEGMRKLYNFRRMLQFSQKEYEENVAKLKGWEKARLEMLANAKKGK